LSNVSLFVHALPDPYPFRFMQDVKTMKTPFPDLTFPLTGADAKKLVFAHWDFLQHLARKRFPTDDNTAHLALDHVLDHLQEEDWRRIRSWQGQGKFSTFVGVLAGRAMTDYLRKVYGHQRAPKWLEEKGDPIWMEAYRILIVERFERQEAFSLLQTRHPEKEAGLLREIVSEVIARCPAKIRYQDHHGASLDDIGDTPSPDLPPESQLEIQPRELLEALDGYIRGDGELPGQVRVLVEKLRQNLHLSDEDRLLLRLRYCEGLKMSQIARLLHLRGDPYKRLNKILKTVRAACEKAGLD